MQIRPIPKAVNDKMKIGVQIRKILKKKKSTQFTNAMEPTSSCISQEEKNNYIQFGDCDNKIWNYKTLNNEN